MVDLTKFENAGQVNEYVDGLEAEIGKLRAEVERLKKCILDGAIPSMNVIEKERDVALLQVEALRGKVNSLREWARGHWDADAPLLRRLDEILGADAMPCAEKQIHPKYNFDDYAPKKGDRYQTQSYIREWDGEQWITLPVPAKQVRLCDSVPPGGGEPCMKEPGHGGVCENQKDVWDWKPKHRGER